MLIEYMLSEYLDSILYFYVIIILNYFCKINVVLNPKLKEFMTSEELVKSMLEADTCELYDKTRINNLLRNSALGHGKIAIVDEATISITHNINKTKKLTYLIPKVLLTDAQLSQI